MTRRNNDILWKVVLEEIFEDLLTFLFPMAEEHFDLKKGFEFLDKELIALYPEPDKKAEVRFVDKLVKVTSSSGDEEWVLVHVEVQNQQDPTFPDRMFRYFTHIFLHYDKPLTAIALFTGKKGPHLAPYYHYQFVGTSLIYQYNALYLSNYTDEELAESDNPFAVALRVAKQGLLEGKTSDEELLQFKLALTASLFKKGFSRKKIKALLMFLHQYLHFDNSNRDLSFLKEINHSIIKNNTTMNIDEVIEQLNLEKGKEVKEYQVIESLLHNTDFSTGRIATLVDAPETLVLKIKARLVSESNTPS